MIPESRKEVNNMTKMSTNEKTALEKLAKIIPKLSDNKKEYFLGVIDGMGIATDKKEPPSDGQQAS